MSEVSPSKLRVYLTEGFFHCEDGSGSYVREATPDEKLLWAETERLREAIQWVVRDAAYKAPEQMGPAMAARWIDRLRSALEGSAVETTAVQSDAEIEAELAMDRRIFGTAYYRRVNGRKERIPPQELFICTEQRSNRMRVAGPEASGEATGPEGDDSNMGTAPTSGPEATSSQGNAVETAAQPIFCAWCAARLSNEPHQHWCSAQKATGERE